MSRDQVYKILARIPDPRLRPEVSHAFEQLATRLGIKLSLSFDPSKGPFDALYAPESDDTVSIANFLPFDARSYDPKQSFAARSQEGLRLWGPREGDPAKLDLVGGIFRLLGLLDESQIAESARNRRGTFGVSALPEERQRTAQEALVENHVQAIRKILGDPKSAFPRWPGGKKFALLLTHDTDALNLASPQEILFNAVKAAVRLDGTRLRMAKEGFSYIGRARENPFYGFPFWKKFAESRRVPSCFYLFARRPGSSRDLNDCRSSVVEQDVDWDFLREMSDCGWEFGLHAPIKASEDLDHFIWGKAFIEEKLRRPVYGLRHHYWALDWRRPYLTYRKHVNAGFRYDTSIAWRDIAGFRAGTCLPFRPFDPECRRPLDMYQLPTSIMDGHVYVPSQNPDTAATAARPVVEEVKRAGGALVLGWHTETACDRYCYDGYVRALGRVLDPLLADDAWVTTPWELIRHWHQRTSDLFHVQ